jgi:hypothetical protein
MKKQLPFPIALTIVVLFIGAAFIGRALYERKIREESRNNSITTFEECVRAGYPVMESYPPRCRSASGDSFIQDSIQFQ